jgi:bacillithiol system protein YtxJ
MMKIMETLEDLNSAIEQSMRTPILLFKHSSTCPISAGAYRRITKGLEDGTLKVDVYIVIVQKSRELSNYIEEKFGIQHESPQVIFVYKKEAVWNASHNSIDVEEVNQTLKKIF